MAFAIIFVLAIVIFTGSLYILGKRIYNILNHIEEL